MREKKCKLVEAFSSSPMVSAYVRRRPFGAVLRGVKWALHVRISEMMS